MDEIKELQTLATTKGVYNSFPDQTARKDLKAKLNAPDSVKAGDYLRVQSIGADGTVVLEGAEGTGNGSGQNATWDTLDGKPTYMQEEQEKFDPAWLPDGGFGWAETGEAAVEWDGSTEGLDVVAVGDMTLVRVSGLLPSAEAMIGRTVELADGSNYEISAETVYQAGPVWVVYGPVGDDLLPVLYGVGATEYQGIAFPATGMYAVLHPDQPYRFARVAIAYETVHGLDPKYLPEEAVREYVIELDYSKTVVTSSGKYAIVGEIPNSLTYTEIRDAYALGQRLVVRLKNTDYPETYLRLVNVGDREWRFEADVGSQYTADRIQKLYLTLINQDISKDTVTARVAYINVELGGGTEQVQADWGQNDPEAPDYVKGRTHWEESNQTVIEWDGDTEGRDSTVIGEDTFYKVSDDTPGMPELVGAHLTFVTGEQFVVAESEIMDFGDVLLLGRSMVVAKKTEFAFNGMSFVFPSVGAYFALDDSVQISKLTYGSTVVHPLDEKWIPESIARRFYLNITADPETGEPVAAETFEEVLSAYNAGMDIVAKVASPDDGLPFCIPLVGYFDEFVFALDQSSYMDAYLYGVRIIYAPNLLEVFYDFVDAFEGATNESDGASGFVPAPNAGDQNKFLRGDGTWADGSDLVLAKSFIIDRENQTLTIGRTTSPKFEYEPVEDWYSLHDEAFYELAKAAIELGLCAVTIKQSDTNGINYEGRFGAVSIGTNDLIIIGDFYIRK